MRYIRLEDETQKVYAIPKREDRRHIEFYCKDRAEENIRAIVRGQCVWEDQIVIEELIKKGALVEA